MTVTSHSEQTLTPYYMFFNTAIKKKKPNMGVIKVQIVYKTSNP